MVTAARNQNIKIRESLGFNRCPPKLYDLCIACTITCKQIFEKFKLRVGVKFSFSYVLLVPQLRFEYWIVLWKDIYIFYEMNYVRFVCIFSDVKIKEIWSFFRIPIFKDFASDPESTWIFCCWDRKKTRKNCEHKHLEQIFCSVKWTIFMFEFASFLAFRMERNTYYRSKFSQ